MLKQVSSHAKQARKDGEPSQWLTYSVLDHHKHVLRNAQKVSMQSAEEKYDCEGILSFK